jgi:hypothetical protein
MAELIVVGFKKDMYRASEVLNTLQEMNDSWRRPELSCSPLRSPATHLRKPA